MALYPEAGKFYVTDVATITANSTYTTVSATIDIAHKRHITINAKATGAAAGSAGDVTFALQARVNLKWSTSTFASHVVTVAGTTEKVSAPEVIEVFGIEALRVASITNGDAAQNIGTVNLNYVMTE